MYWREATIQFPHLHLKNTNTVLRDHHFDIDWTQEVKIIWESQRTWVQKYILMRDRRRRENNKHAPRAAFLLFVDFYIAFESVIPSSFEFFVSIQLLLAFDCPFFVGQLGFDGAHKIEDLTKSKNFCGKLLQTIGFIILAKKNFWC